MGWRVEVVVIISVSFLVNAPIFLVEKEAFGFQKEEKFQILIESGRTI